MNERVFIANWIALLPPLANIRVNSRLQNLNVAEALVLAFGAGARVQRRRGEGLVSARGRRVERDLVAKEARAARAPVKAGEFLHRIGLMLHGEREIAPGRFCRSLQTVAFRIIEPAMISAGDAALFDSAVRK